MKALGIIIFSALLFITADLTAQGYVKIGGNLKITDVPPDNNSEDSVLVRQNDGTVAQRLIESLNDRNAASCSMGYYVIPYNFDFQNIPASHANSIWEIRHCHDLQNSTVTLPANVILSFRGGRLNNFQNLIGNSTRIEASSIQILDGTTVKGTWTLEYVNVCWFGAKPDPSFDSQPSFTKATTFANTNEGIRRILIPSGKYHLADHWRISSTGLWNPIKIDGYGAVLDNTVIVASFGVSLSGLTVDGAARHGFVFLRGQGAHHEHLVAQNCGLDGFYCGIDVGGGEYGYNFQVTRSAFISFIALNNGRHGWYFEGASTANRSWFNANSVISFGAVNNTAKGFAWQGGAGPNGNSQINYNTFVNMNCEGNDDISVDMPEGRANTYIGGHYVDKDVSGKCVNLGGPYNFNLGGRYVGEVTNPAFIYSNTDQAGQGGIIANMHGADNIQTKNFEASNEAFMPKGWSIMPRALESSVVAPDNLYNHQFSIDLNKMPTADGLMIRLTRFGQRNFSGGNGQKYAYSLLIHLNKNTSGAFHLDWNRLSDDKNCTVNSVTEIGGVVTIDFTTTYLTFGGYGVTEYQNAKDTDFR